MSGASPQQRHLWALCGGGPCPYRVEAVFSFDPPATPAALAEAAGRVIARHEILRTRLVQTPAGVEQIVDPPEPVEISTLGPGEAWDPAPFDPGLWPPLRLGYRAGEDGGRLHVSASALCADATTLELLAGELSAALQGQRRDPDEGALQYGDVARWLEAAASRAREALGGPAPAPPPDLFPATRAADLGRVEARVGEEVAAAIEGVAAEVGAPAATAWLACWQWLAARALGVPAQPVAFMHDGRGYPELRDALGPLAARVPLPPPAEADPDLRTAISAASAAVKAATQPPSRIAEDVAGLPSFSYRPPPTSAGRVRLLELHDLSRPIALELTCAREPAGAALTLRYDPALFPHELAARLVRWYAALAAGAASAPSRRLGEHPLAGPDEVTRAARALDGGPPAAPGEAPAHAAFERLAAASPDAPAIVAGVETVTYGELEARANRLAHHLREAGVAGGAVVGVLLERSVEEVVAVLATLKAGGAFLLLDPSHPPDRLRRILDEAAPAAVLTAEGLAALVPGLARHPASPPALVHAPLSPAYVVFTSGSTGAPKGAVNTHLGTTNLIAWMGRELGVTARDRVLRKAPGGFDVGVWEILLPLSVGGCIVVCRPGGHRDPAYLVQLIRERGVTTVHFVPSMLRAFLDAPGVEDCASLARILCGGEAMPGELRDRLRARTRAQLFHLYGPSEAAVDVTCWRDREGPLDGPVPMGTPIAGDLVRVLDRQMRAVVPGMPGELYVGGCGVGLGYLGRPGLTAARFVPDPLGPPGARLYRTGDLVRQRADGALQFLRRSDDQVKLRGLRIEPAEVEAALNALPGVRHAAVAIHQPPGGEPRLTGYVAVRPGATLSAPELRQALAARLPDPMIPTAWVFLDELPLLPSGKLDRRALPAAEPGAEHRGGPLRTPAERVLAALWCRLFGVGEASPDDDFFDAGGHSLLAMRFVSEIREAFGVEISPAVVLEQPRLRQLAAAIEAAGLGGGAAPTSKPVERVPRDGPLPLSFAQERLWFLHRLAPDDPAYNVTAALRLSGRLDLDALRRSLEALVRRHEVLSCRIVEIAGAPRLAHDPAAPLPFRALDAADLQAARSLHDEEAARPFDLARDLPVRATVARVNDAEHVLLLSVHHIACDDASMVILLREALALYAGFAAGQEARLEPLRVQYADFASWQRERVAALLPRQLAYWKERLAGPLPAPRLPGERPPAATGPRYGRVSRSLPPGIVQAISDASRALGATPFMTLLASYLALLRRTCDETDLVVGCPIGGRDRAELEGMVGILVNLLPIRVDLAGVGAFSELVGRVRAAALGAYVHQDLPFERMVEEGVQPFRAGFALYDLARPPLEAPGLTIQALDGDRAAPKMDLLLTVDVTGEAPSAAFEYDARILDGAVMGRLLAAWQVLLEAAIADPARRVAALPLVNEAERRHLLEAAGDPSPPPLGHRGPLARFREVAERAKDAIALEFDDGTLTYGELAAAAAAVGDRLRRCGVRNEAPVGLLLERSARLVTAALGILDAGGAFVPLDPADPPARIERIVRDAGIRVLVAGDPAAVVPPGVEALVLGPDWRAAPPGQAGALSEGPPPDALACIFYTSGSTGQPKGVGVTNGGVLRLAAGQRTPALGPQDRVAQIANPCFDAFTWELWVPLLSGARLVGIRRSDVVDPRVFAARLRERGITVAVVTTPVLHQVIAEQPSAFSGLRWLGFGGETADPGAVRALLEAGPPRELLNVYGPTETTTIVAWHVVEGVNPREPLPIGKPILGSRLYVLDSGLELVPPGIPGELHVGGEGVSRGYIGRPALTAERFVPDPFSPVPGQRLYATGDLARWRDDGTLEFLGRRDDQLKVRGHRVEAGEIEAALRGHPAVAQALVLVTGQGAEQRLTAHLVARGERVPAAEMLDFLRARLPAHFVPAGVVWHGALPLTPRGKVDRAALAATPPDRIERAPAASPGAPGAPRTPAEEVVARAWGEALGTAVGRHDDFFAAGGHSLLAVRVAARLRDAFGIDVPVRLVFEGRTVAGVAAAIDGLRRGGGAPAIPGPEATPPAPRAPLSLPQEQIWLFEQLFPGRAFHHIHSTFRITGALEISLMAVALERLALRHEALRTTFTFSDETGPEQVISPTAPQVLELHDLSGLPPAQAEAELRRIEADARRRPFDLDRGPLWRFTLARLGPAEHRVEVTVHHIVCDGESLEVLVRELGALYAALASGGAGAPLPPAAVQYRDFARWQRERLSADRLPAQVSYWRQALGGDLQPLRLGPGGAAAPVTLRVRATRAELDGALVERLRALAAREGTTLFATVLAAVAMALRDHTGQHDIRVATLAANRHRTALEGLVGLLTNMLILRLDLSGAAAPAEALRRARGAVFSAFDHQDLPFEELLAVLESERENLDRRALAQVMLVLEDAPPLRLELPGLSVEPGALDVDGGAEGMSLSGFDLVVRVVRQGEGMVIHLRYKEGTLDDVEAKRLAGQVRGALELLAGAPPAVTQQDDVLERYERDGFAIFRNVIDPDLIAEAREHVAWLLRRYPDLRPEHLHHPLIRNDAFWVRLVTDPRLLRIAERFLGPDLACFTAHYICKPARGGMPVLWHQDGAYWKLEPMQALTVWLAIDESSPENGCLRVVPGSHRLPLQPIEVRTSPRNMLCSTIGADVDVSTAVDLVLQPGDVSIHHPHVVHGSEANGSDRRRCGLDIGYIPTSVAIRNTGLYTNPLLVRGSPVPGVNVYRPWPEYSPETSIPFAGCEAWNDRARQVNERHGFVHTSREDVLVETARIIRRLEEGTVKS